MREKREKVYYYYYYILKIKRGSESMYHIFDLRYVNIGIVFGFQAKELILCFQIGLFSNWHGTKKYLLFIYFQYRPYT
jgi:hypothetical protein